MWKWAEICGGQVAPEVAVSGSSNTGLPGYAFEFRVCHGQSPGFSSASYDDQCANQGDDGMAIFHGIPFLPIWQVTRLSKGGRSFGPVAFRPGVAPGLA